MTPLPLRCLVIQDDPRECDRIADALRRGGFQSELTCAATQEDFIAGLGGSPDIILSEYSLPGYSGLTALGHLRSHPSEVPMILLSGEADQERAIQAIQEGACDYIAKDRIDRLPISVMQALVLKRLRTQCRRDQEAVRKTEARLKLILEHSPAAAVPPAARWDGSTILRADATDHERTRQALVESESRLQEARALAKLGSWTWDVAAGRIEWSEGGPIPFGEGFGPQPLTYAEFLATVHAGDRARVDSALRRAAHSAHGYEFECRIVPPHGPERHIQARGKVLPPEHKEPRGFGYVQDVTDQRGLEERLVRVQRIESLGLLSAGIAHDFNNVLAPVTAACDLLRTQINDDENLELIAMIEQSARNGAALAQQILSCTQGLTRDLGPAPLKKIAQEIIAIMRTTFPSNIRLVSHVDPQLWFGHAKPVKIHQVLLNLCVNARDAMHNGGTLTFRAANCILSAEVAAKIPGARPGRFVRFEVSDTGEGIPPELMDTVWQPFFTTKSSGTGLGLSIVRTILESCKGFGQLDSKPGVGTTFQIYFPAEAAASEPDRAFTGKVQAAL